MLRRVWLLSALLLVPVAACGGDDDASEPRSQTPATEGVSASGSGWSAIFPGEVEYQSDPVPLPGGAGETSADSTTWETASEALTVVTSDFPPELLDMVDTAALLEGTATANGGTIVGDSSVLDDEGTFRGRDAVTYEVTADGIVTTGLAAFDGQRLYQVLHVSRDDDASAWVALLESFEFTD